MLKIGDYVIVKRIIGFDTILAKKSIGKVGKVQGIESSGLPISVEYFKPLTNDCFGMQYSENELEKIDENDILAYLI